MLDFWLFLSGCADARIFVFCGQHRAPAGLTALKTKQALGRFPNACNRKSNQNSLAHPTARGNQTKDAQAHESHG